jgi:hypothetical protein
MYLESTVELVSGGPYNAGTGGAGGTGAPTAGGTGGDAMIVLNGTTFVAKGGTGGLPAVKAPSGVTGPTLPAQGSGPAPIITYGEGSIGWWVGPTAAASGRGGSSPFGAGGVAVGVGSGGIAGIRGAGGSGGASATSIVGGPGGDGIFIIDEYTTASLARTPNGCTAVVMTSPAAPFAIAAGASLALSATATCPLGQVPEFEFRVKRVRDAAFNAAMLGGYRTTSTATFTPPTPDAWCVSVAVRAVGALEAFQAIAPAVCGTVIDENAPILAATTINVPVSPLPVWIIGPTFTNPANVVNTGPNGGIAFPVHGIPVGATVTGARATIADMAGATVTLYLIAKEVTVASSPTWTPIGSTVSAGTGATQELAIGGLLYQVPRATELALALEANGVAVSPLSTYVAEVDYQ